MNDRTADPQTSAPRPDPNLPFPRAAAALEGLPLTTWRALLAAPADLVLLVDAAGVLRDVAVAEDARLRDAAQRWVGLAWADVVSEDSRNKVASMMKGTWREQAATPAATAPAAVASGALAELPPPVWRHVNFIGPADEDIPLSVCTVALPAGAPPGSPLRLVVYARDLRPLAAMQQRLVEAQQSMERDYLRFRHAETRYRHLFQVAGEPMLVIDAASLRIVEANPAAAALLLPALAGAGAAGGAGGGGAQDRLIGAPFPSGLHARHHEAVTAMLAQARATGRVESLACELADGRGEVQLSTTLFRQDPGTFFLVRLTPPGAAGATAGGSDNQALLVQLARSAPDGLVITDLEGRILAANPAFVEAAQLATEEQLRGESLDRWLGRTGVDLSVLISNLRQRGSVRLFATTLRGTYGASTEVEISATVMPRAQEAVLGFTVRDVGRRLAADARGRRELPRSVAQLTELVGRVPLKDIVGETTDLIEQLCIEAALELTRDNRASAAEMLGLSRQSLYVKLRRFGLGDLGGDAEGSTRP